MGKRSKAATVEEENKHDEIAEANAEDVAVAKKKKKKDKHQGLEDGTCVDEDTLQDPTEQVSSKKSKKRIAEEGAADDDDGMDVAVIKKKKKKQQIDSANDPLIEESEQSSKKAKTKGVAAEADADVQAEPAKKKKKKVAQVEEEDENAEDGVSGTEGNTRASKGSGRGKGIGKSKDKARNFDGKSNRHTAFVRGLLPNTKESTLRKHFSDCGEISDIRLPLNDDGQCKGFAFIQFDSKEGFDACVAKDGCEIKGRQVFISQQGKKVDAKEKHAREHDRENTVFVRGLSFETEKDDLAKEFGGCGEIANLHMPVDAEGQCRGIAYIKFASREACDSAMEYNGSEYGGRTIYVCMSGEMGEKGQDKKGKGKDKDGKGKDKGKKGKKGKGKYSGPSESFAKSSGALVESTGKKQTFDSDDE